MLEVAWEYDAHQRVDSLLHREDDVVAAVRHSRLVVLDAQTGVERWSTSVGNTWGWIAASGSTVYYLEQHSKLSAYDRRNGAVRWSVDLGGIQGWLHASEATVVVGGWRDYTDIRALNASDGTLRWRRDSSGARVHSTRLHFPSNSVVVADRATARLRFFDLETGVCTAEADAPGAWTERCCERPPQVRDVGAPLVMRCDDDSFLLVKGSAPTVERVRLPDTLVSQDLEIVRGYIPYITRGGEVAAWSVEEERRFALGRLDHERTDQLPFDALADRRFVLGSSRGIIEVRAEDGTRIARRHVGKRVSTALSVRGGVVAFGTTSGKLLGLHCPGA